MASIIYLNSLSWSTRSHLNSPLSASSMFHHLLVSTALAASASPARWASGYHDLPFSEYTCCFLSSASSKRVSLHNPFIQSSPFQGTYSPINTLYTQLYEIIHLFITCFLTHMYHCQHCTQRGNGDMLTVLYRTFHKEHWGPERHPRWNEVKPTTK